MRWTLVDLDDDRFKMCGEYRSTKSKKVMCEYHPDSHPIDHHFGRGRTGRWYSWPVDVEEPTWVTAPWRDPSHDPVRATLDQIAKLGGKQPDEPR